LSNNTITRTVKFKQASLGEILSLNFPPTFEYEPEPIPPFDCSKANEWSYSLPPVTDKEEHDTSV